MFCFWYQLATWIQGVARRGAFDPEHMKCPPSPRPKSQKFLPEKCVWIQHWVSATELSKSKINNKRRLKQSPKWLIYTQRTRWRHTSTAAVCDALSKQLLKWILMRQPKCKSFVLMVLTKARNIKESINNEDG